MRNQPNCDIEDKAIQTMKIVVALITHDLHVSCSLLCC